jgi:hypothetical protein
VVAWGGDMSPVDEGQVEIALPPDAGRVADLAARLHAWGATPARGAGILRGVPARGR